MCHDITLFLATWIFFGHGWGWIPPVGRVGEESVPCVSGCCTAGKGVSVYESGRRLSRKDYGYNWDFIRV